jgi:hypothetical protein
VLGTLGVEAIMDRTVKASRFGVGAAAILAAILAAIVAQPVSAGAPRTRWVDDDGHAGAAGCGAGATAFRKIQPAIDASSAGDTIVVCPGVYRRNLSIAGSTRDDLTIRGATIGTAIVRAPQAGGSAPLTAIDGANGITVRGLVFQAPTGGTCRRVSALLRIEGAPDTRVIDTRFEPLGPNTIGPCGYTDAIEIVDGSTAFIDRASIRDFRLEGVDADPGTSVVVEDSSVRYMHASEAPAAFSIDATGLYASSNVSVVFRRNSIRSGKSAGPRGTPVLGNGIVFHAESTIARNDVGYVLWGISTDSSGGTIRDNAVHHGRKIGDEVPIGFWLVGGELLNVYANTAKGTSAGILVVSGGESHSIHDNDFRGNSPHDCRDTTTGSGTSSTANFWTSNLGIGSSPTGICNPP